MDDQNSSVRYQIISFKSSRYIIVLGICEQFFLLLYLQGLSSLYEDILRIPISPAARAQLQKPIGEGPRSARARAGGEEKRGERESIK